MAEDKIENKKNTQPVSEMQSAARKDSADNSNSATNQSSALQSSANSVHENQTPVSSAAANEAANPEKPIILKAVHPTYIRNGLSADEVRRKKAAGEYNKDIEDNFKSNGEIVRDNVFTYFNLVLAIIAVILLIFRSYNNLMFIFVAIINSVIGIFREIGTRDKLKKIELMHELETTVVRDAKLQKIPNTEIVLEDCLVLSGGQQLSVDAILVSGQLTVNESLVTGEAQEIVKSPGDALLSGSFIVSGEGRAMVTKVSADTFAAKIAIEAKATKSYETVGMMKSLDKLIKGIGIAAVPVAVILFMNQYVRLGIDLVSSVESTAASIIGMIPAGLYLLVSLALARAAIKLSRQKVYVQEMNSIESLARVDILCLDKTGTITSDTMQLKTIKGLDGASVTPEVLNSISLFAKYMPADNETMLTIKEYFAEVEANKAEIAKAEVSKSQAAKGAMDKSALDEQLSSSQKDNSAKSVRREAESQTDKASLASQAADNSSRIPQNSANFADLPDLEDKDIKPLKTLRFTSLNKYSALSFKEGQALVMGAPEIILQEDFFKYKAAIAKEAEFGSRILAFAKYTYVEEKESDIFRQTGKLTGTVEPLAFIVLENPLRENAKEIFKFFSNEGVKIKVISGDNPETVSVVAKAAGIKNADKYIDARELKEEADFAQAVETYTVFGRVTPEQKRQLIETMQKQGHTVGMTGDGVNDVLALKKADMGIAMASGADAASQVADVVLGDSDFGHMPDVLAEGRQVINNIERSAALFLNKNFFTLFMTLACIITGTAYQWEPIQMTIISTLFVGIPGFFLALEHNTDKVSGKFLSNVLLNALPKSLLAVFTTLIAINVCNLLNVPAEMRSTVALYAFGFTMFLMVDKVSQPLDILKKLLLTVLAAAFLLATTLFRQFFATSLLDLNAFVAVVSVCAISVPLSIVLEGLFIEFTEQVTIWRQKLQVRKAKRQIKKTARLEARAARKTSLKEWWTEFQAKFKQE